MPLYTALLYHTVGFQRGENAICTGNIVLQESPRIGTLVRLAKGVYFPVTAVVQDAVSSSFPRTIIVFELKSITDGIAMASIMEDKTRWFSLPDKDVPADIRQVFTKVFETY